MATKTSHPAAGGPSQGMSAQAGATQIIQQAGGQLAQIAETSAMLYSATEAIQQINQQLTQRAALRQQQMAERLRQASSPGEMMALGSGMFSSTLQEATQYWQDVAAAALKMNTSLMERSASQASQAVQTAQAAQPPAPAVTPAQPLNPALQAWQGLVPAQAPAVNPALQAWQNLFMAPMNAFSNATQH